MVETTNPEAIAPTEVDDATLGAETAELEPPEGGEGEGEDGSQGAHEDDEEIEYHGRKVRIPKGVQAERLMQADYTRKTQELAEARKALDTEKASFTKVGKETIQAAAKVQALDDRLAEYSKLTPEDWTALQRDEPDLYNQHWRQRTLLTEARQKANDELQSKERERETEGQRIRAKAVGDTQAILARDIKGWGPELAGKLTGFAKDQGFTDDDLIAMNTDARAIKVLNLAYQTTQAGKTQAAATAAQKTAAVAPTPRVGQGASPAIKGLDDRLSTSDWFKRRDAQVNAKRGA